MRRWLATTMTVLVVTLIMAATFAHEAGAWVAQNSAANAPAQPVSPGTHYLTFRGADFHPVNTNDQLLFAPNTGGGVWYHDSLQGESYAEAGLDLPDGATVTGVTFFVRDCEDATAINQVYFGAYRPSTGSFAYFVSPADPPQAADCSQTVTVPYPVNPPATVDNSQQRYVLGYVPNVIYAGTIYNSSIKQLLVGARVAYQAPGAFLPSIKR